MEALSTIPRDRKPRRAALRSIRRQVRDKDIAAKYCNRIAWCPSRPIRPQTPKMRRRGDWGLLTLQCCIAQGKTEPAPAWFTRRRRVAREQYRAKIVMDFLANKVDETMIPRQRSAFSAIVDRPPLKLPIAPASSCGRSSIWSSGRSARPMARQVLPAPTGQVLLPDVPNWAWHEYGMRVGVWRFFELFAPSWHTA